MAKKKDNLWSGKNRDKAVDGMFASMAESVQDKLGMAVSIGAGPAIVGLPLEALSQRVLFASTVLPLNKVVQLVGLEGCNKSAFMYDMVRWHLQAQGGACIAENENKDPQDLRSGIMCYREDWLRRINISKTAVLQEWQNYLVQSVMTLRKTMDDPKVGYTIPVAFCVDSLTSTSPIQDADKANEAGGASDRRHPLMAGLIASWFREHIREFRGLPITIIATNHLKPTKPENSHVTEQRVPGGRAVPFMASFMIRLDKIGTLDTLDYGGNRLRLTTTKNSYGPTGHHVIVDFLWWHDTHENNYRPRFGFDWHTASIDLLLRQEDERKTLFKALMAICDLKARKKDRLVWSHTLGIPEDAPVPYREAGMLLEHRPDLLVQIHPLLHIADRTPFLAGVDFRDLLLLEKKRDEALQAARPAIELPAVIGDEAKLVVDASELHKAGADVEYESGA